jgi:hypothetical protein
VRELRVGTPACDSRFSNRRIAMLPFRTMLYDHCVITFPANHDAECQSELCAWCQWEGARDLSKQRPGQNSHSPQQRAILRTVLLGLVITLAAVAMAFHDVVTCGMLATHDAAVNNR